jgi:hypothetical protein
MFQLIRDNGLNWCGDDISTMMNEIKSIEVLDRVVIAVGSSSCPLHTIIMTV